MIASFASVSQLSFVDVGRCVFSNGECRTSAASTGRCSSAGIFVVRIILWNWRNIDASAAIIIIIIIIIMDSRRHHHHHRRCCLIVCDRMLLLLLLSLIIIVILPTPTRLTVMMMMMMMLSGSGDFRVLLG